MTLIRSLPTDRQTLRTLLAAAAIVAAVGTAGRAATPALPAELVRALANDGDSATETCAGLAHQSVAAYANANYSVRTVTLRSGSTMAVVEGGGSCVCGQNCKFEVFQKRGDRYVSVLSSYTIGADVRPDGTVVTNAHDSAAVQDRSTYRWNGATYLDVKDEIVYDERVVKPAIRHVAFAPGTSSALLTGTQLTLGFDDRFDFVGSAGQTVTLSFVARDAHVDSFSLAGPGGKTLGSAKRGTLTVTLPASGRYDLDVSGADESMGRYSLRIAIE